MNGAESRDVLWKGRCKTKKDLEMANPWGCIFDHSVFNNFITLMKLEGSIPCSKDISTGPCSEPNEST